MTNNRFDPYPPGTAPRSTLAALGTTKTGKRPPPLPKPGKAPKSDPAAAYAKPEAPTRPNSPAHRAARLVAKWAKLPAAKMAAVELVVDAFYSDEFGKGDTPA